jgi:transglutaminase-like putative cysteine protease
MRILVSHITSYLYDHPPNSVIQLLRLTPRHHEGQYVMRWRIDVSQDCRLDQREDAFGNIVHAFTLRGPVDGVSVHVEGEVETQDTAGVVRGAIERFPPSLFLRETPLTEPDAAIAAFAAGIAAYGANPLDRMHALLSELHREMTFDTDPTHTHTTAAQAFALKRGVCQDLAHIFIAAARSIGVPARYVSGHMHRADGVIEQQAGHAWAEAFVPQLGWVGFDPTNEVCATEGHVRVAVGLDYLGAAPVRGARYGGDHERLAVNVRVAQGQIQTQS